MPVKKLERLEDIEKELIISLPRMRRISKDFLSQMRKGLSEEKSSLKMLSAYVDRPNGFEKGRFIALDLGGTNLRVLEVELSGGGKIFKKAEKKIILQKKHLSGKSCVLFDFIAACLKGFIKENKISLKNPLFLGFTFSFPVQQTSLNRGILIHWTKGFSLKGVVGVDVVRLLEASLKKQGLFNLKVAALVNDTVGTLASRSYRDKHCDIGVILGTGTNACYRERAKTKIAHTIINIEWGNFNLLPLTSYDLALDRLSENRGEQILEKMVSGMYLGRLAGLIFGLKEFKAEHISLIESGRMILPGRDKVLVKKICRLICLRAARIVAAALGAIVIKIDRRLERSHIVAVDGSLYEKHPYFAQDINCALRELFGKKSRRIKLVLTKDGSGLGAAIIAAVAAS